jgi:hypothetical protein
MAQLQVRIKDAQSAANAYVAMTKFGAPAKLPADAAELTRRLKRISGRGREIAAALQMFVDAKGFDALAEAVGRSRTNHAPSIRDAAPTDTEAASTPGSLSFAELHGVPLMFASSGLY